MCVVPLAWKYRGDPVLPLVAQRIQYPQLVVDHDVVPRRVALLDGLEHLLLVHVDQDATVDRIPDAGSLDLARLEHHIAVRQDHRLAHALKMSQDLQCIRVQTFGEGVIDEEARHAQQLGDIQVFESVLLQRAQIIHIPQAAADLFQDLGVPVAAGRSVFCGDVVHQIADEPVVVEQRVVDIDQEHNVGRSGGGGLRCHALPSYTGLDRSQRAESARAWLIGSSGIEPSSRLLRAVSTSLNSG